MHVKFRMLLAFHIDKVDDDDPADISQSHLTGNFPRGFHIRFKHRLFQIFVADVFSRIDVDCGQRLRLINDKVRPTL